MSIDPDEREDKIIKGVMSIDKILFACVSSYLLGMVLWISGNEQFWSVQGKSFGETARPSLEDTRFVDYIRRSLLVIENQQKQPQVSQAPQTPMQASPSPTPGSTPINSNQLDNIYVPVATFQQPTPVMPPPPPLARSSVPLPTPLPKPVTSPSKLIKTPVSIIPPPPPKPTTVPILGQSPIAQLPTAGQGNPNFGYSLVGLMESGDKSAALFNINGITQRINLGEEIGGSGWSLLSVSNQQAVVSRGGETRFIYVGSKF